MLNYFELYGIPLSFRPDIAAVKRQYYALSKKYHPDFFANKSDKEQEEALEMSTENTKAYQTLSNRKEVFPYVLGLLGIIEEGEQYALPPSFLMEMMEVNEVLMDLQFDANPELLKKIIAQVKSFEEDLETELNALTEEFDQSEDHQKQVKLEKIKDLYYRAKYLARLNETISKLS